MHVALLLISLAVQTDTVRYQWPNPPFDRSHYINGTFAEFRNTLSSNHFHNAVDIGEPDGNPIYPVLDGVVDSYSPSSVSGSNAYLRVRTPVPGGWKHITYLHMEPNPGLTVGMPVVVGQTVLGAIISGQGHVHLTEREIVATEMGNGAEINNLRAGGGLTPFEDLWSPVIDLSTLQVRSAVTGATMLFGALQGAISVRVKVDERNSPEALGGTRTNNGTYAVGFRILSADTQTTVLEAAGGALRYKFDRMPVNADVGNAFDEAQSNTGRHVYILTNGGGAQTVNETRRVDPSSLNVDVLPEAWYLLHLFSYDTRGNRHDTHVPIFVTKSDLTPPSAPTLQWVMPAGDSIDIAWHGSPDADVLGYRVSHQYGGTWTLAAGESLLTVNARQFRFGVPPGLSVPAGGLPRFAFRVTAVDTAAAHNESAPSDTYGGTPTFYGAVNPGRTALIVDGFDRWTGGGSWTQATHALALSSMQAIRGPIAIGTAANETVADGTISLSGRHYVHWLLGDESTVDHTFTSAEQQRVAQYLESGGALFVSGSEVGWDLARTHSLTEPGDLAFYTNYLKASFVFDGNTAQATASGVSGTPFQGYTWTFGQVFPEDFPDDIEPAGGAVALLNYNVQRDAATFRKAGIGYVGTFGASANTGRLVYVAFPLESMTSTLVRQTMIDKALQFMGITTGVEEGVKEGGEGVRPEVTELMQNYPNPFNSETVVRYWVSGSGNRETGNGYRVAGTTDPDTYSPLPNSPIHVSLRIYDLLGREVSVLVDEEKGPGAHAVSWNAAGFTSGQYFARLVTGGRVHVKPMVLLK
ncbi:MAG: hypothetical protein MUE68_06825 [Bacteroidetes bacterium]|jgi:hypothetical protein|nr:hypothetical protein [Bacteroidota bacterium]